MRRAAVADNEAAFMDGAHEPNDRSRCTADIQSSGCLLRGRKLPVETQPLLAVAGRYLRHAILTLGSIWFIPRRPFPACLRLAY